MTQKYLHDFFVSLHFYVFSYKKWTLGAHSKNVGLPLAARDRGIRSVLDIKDQTIVEIAKI